MNNIHLKNVFASAIIVLIGLSAQGAILAEWNFNNFGSTATSNGFGESVLADVGAGTLFVRSATATGTNFERNTSGGTLLNASEGTLAGGTARLRRGERWNNGYADFRFSTLGQEDVTFSFAASYNANFPTVTTVSWSIDEGANFTSLGTFSRPGSDAFTVYSYDLSAVTAVDNMPNVWVRLSFSADGGVNSNTGGLILDNAIVTAIPEPSTMALVGLALGAAALLRRRRV